MCTLTQSAEFWLSITLTDIDAHMRCRWCGCARIGQCSCLRSMDEFCAWWFGAESHLVFGWFATVPEHHIHLRQKRKRERQCEKVDRLIWLVLFLFVCLPRGCCSSEFSPTKHSHYIGFCINQTSILWHHLTDLQRHCNGKKHRIRFLVLLLPFPYAYQQSTPNKIFFYVETAYFLVLQKAIRQQKCVNQFDNRRQKIRRMTASFL